MISFNSIEKLINQLIAKDLKIENNQVNLKLQDTPKEYKGQKTIVVFSLVKYTKQNPEQTAKYLGSLLKEKIDSIESFNVIKGFVNFIFSDSFWMESLKEFLETKKQEYLPFELTNKKYIVEYASPNTNKPLHLGHLLNMFLGWSIAVMYNKLGYEVVKTQIVNDRGIHICKSMLAWKLFGDNQTPLQAGIKGDFFVGRYYVKFDEVYKKEVRNLVDKGMSEEEAKENAPVILQARKMLKSWEQGDVETLDLWKKMNTWVYDGFRETFNRFKISFDDTDYESDTYITGKEMILQGLEQGTFYQKEDMSISVNLDEYNIDDKLLLRADHTAVYITQDLGTAVIRYKKFKPFSGMVYVVADEQNHHFKTLFSILKKMGYQWAENCYHLSYGMVTLPEGKMKSREGNVVDADDLFKRVRKKIINISDKRETYEALEEKEKNVIYDKLTLAALKYFLLKSDPKKGMLFNIEESVDINGNTGLFVMYTYVRIQSLITKADKKEFIFEHSIFELKSIEKEIIIHLVKFSSVVKEAGLSFKPSLMAGYVYKLSKLYNSYYQSVSILRLEDKVIKNYRLLLSQTVGEVIKIGFEILGIEVVDRM